MIVTGLNSDEKQKMKGPPLSKQISSSSLLSKLVIKKILVYFSIIIEYIL
jgi:hypothetical protein